MKIIATIILCIAFTFNLLSQSMFHNMERTNKTIAEKQNFYEIQKSFYDYWKPYNVIDGYYYQDGIKKKASGWTQFKRWEWFWQYRIDPETGEFPTISSAEIYEQLKQSASFRTNEGNWTNIGPAYPNLDKNDIYGLGRLNCVGFREGDTNVLYAGSASGGLWKTTDCGESWDVLTDYNDVLGISDIVVIPGTATTNDTIYVATGDRGGGDNNSIGVMKSIDGGLTWTSTDIVFDVSDNLQISRLLLDPNNTKKIIASSSYGIYITTDGGANWPQVSTISFDDMEFHPSNAQIVYGSKSGYIYKSVDGGSTWTEIENYSTNGRRIRLAVTADEPDWVYAVVVYKYGGLLGIYKSIDSGSTYTQIFDGTIYGNNLLGWSCYGTDDDDQASYDLCIISDPNDANIIFIGGINTWRSIDGGNTWSINSGSCGNAPGSNVHVDKHFFAYQNETNALFDCNDGGLYKTNDNGDEWSFIGKGLIIGQLYRLGVSQTNYYSVICGQQDNGSRYKHLGVWEFVAGGDGMECIIDLNNDHIQYSCDQYGNIRRTQDRWQTSSTITNDITGDQGWVTPYLLNPQRSETIYVGYEDVWKSSDSGSSWEQLSDFNESVLYALTVAPSDSNYIYASVLSFSRGVGTKIFRSTDDGQTWTNVTNNLPLNFVGYLTVKNDNSNTVWVSMGKYDSDGVYQTTDGGVTWTNISAGLPQIPVNCVAQNIENDTVVELYAGTDVGVYYKLDDSDWALFSNQLPNVIVNELEIYYDNEDSDLNSIRAATYGRGMWESQLYGVTEQPIKAEFYANKRNPLIDMDTVSFRDISRNNPTSWLWSFSPTTIEFVNGTSSSSQHPQVVFKYEGDYTVELTASNVDHTNTETKTGYISAVAPVYWTGATNYEWDEPTNWSSGIVPDTSTHVKISSGATTFPYIKPYNLYIGRPYGYNCKSLQIADGGECDLIWGCDAYVYGNLYMSDGAILSLSSNGSSLYIQAGGNLFMSGGEIKSTSSGNTTFYLFDNSGGYMSGGSITITSSINFQDTNWKAASGSLICGRDASPVNIVANSLNLFLNDLIIKENVTVNLSASSIKPLILKGELKLETGATLNTTGQLKVGEGN